MKKFTLYTVLILGIALTSIACKKTKSKKDICDENIICYTEKPNELSLTVKVTKPETLEEIPIVHIYKGTYDKGNFLSEYAAVNKEMTFMIAEGNEYTGVAFYINGNDTIAAFDHIDMTSISYKNCDETCYDWDEEFTLDLRLKDGN